MVGMAYRAGWHGWYTAGTAGRAGMAGMASMADTILVDRNLRHTLDLLMLWWVSLRFPRACMCVIIKDVARL